MIPFTKTYPVNDIKRLLALTDVPMLEQYPAAMTIMADGSIDKSTVVNMFYVPDDGKIVLHAPPLEYSGVVEPHNYKDHAVFIMVLILRKATRIMDDPRLVQAKILMEDTWQQDGKSNPDSVTAWKIISDAVEMLLDYPISMPPDILWERVRLLPALADRLTAGRTAAELTHYKLTPHELYPVRPDC